jgi:CBS-domain-containing membrane protein
MFQNKKILSAIFSSLGAFICITFLAFINMKDVSNLWLIPPFGASMVLVMSVHSSPLAHPKNIFFGHTLSALSGVIIYSLIGINPLSIGLALGLAITIHPPAGGNPIIAVMGAKSFDFVIIPVALGAIFIIIFSYLYNRSVGRIYLLKNISKSNK